MLSYSAAPPQAQPAQPVWLQHAAEPAEGANFSFRITVSRLRSANSDLCRTHSQIGLVDFAGSFKMRYSV